MCRTGIANMTVKYWQGWYLFWSYDRGPFALFADKYEPLNYVVKAILLMINPMKYICVYKPRIQIQM